MNYFVEYHLTRLIGCTSKFEISKNQIPRISCVFWFMLYWKHQKNTHKLTLGKKKDKLCYNMVFDHNASVISTWYFVLLLIL